MRVQTAPGIWKDEGPGRCYTASVGFVIRPVLTIGNMVGFSNAVRQDVGDKRRAQMAEAKQREREKKRRAHGG